ncbi:hypothetical protein FPOAC2_06134 [Fusarium poae]|jgi:hypothetical protein|uniref:Uncharacterized protein n=1 Tax=Fusarium poae TaxID=36050 RepID=A0A1B8AWN4_FUSPO|nr:hypothetical protein FPOAC1_006017 [Fusarium poae]KAG8672731.1 hypothetical protein FPOAC1_006017 [Fusarium poae]OBS24930.1 hypothetical protein FPOA_05466 [Fusarium poae]
MELREPINNIREPKHIHASFLKRSTQAHPPAYRAKPNFGRLDASEWPELPKIRGIEQSTAVRSGVTIADMERLARETWRDEVALMNKLYRRGIHLPNPTQIWVARLREDYRSGTLLSSPHEVEEGQQIERVLRRNDDVTNL